MCEEIELHRYDETPWGFRLTGGHDFGIPLTVVRVTGGSLAEEAGMCVGDMIIEINGDSTAQITHSEAQQCILEAGNRILLSVLRGSPVPAVTPTRGLYTPSIGIDRAASSIGSITEYESIHDGNTYRNNVGSIVPETHDSSGQQMTEEEIAEKLLESAEVIENNGKNVIGVNFKRFVPKCDFIKNSLVFQTLQEEQIFDQKSEEEQLKRCPTKRFSTFLTTPNRPKIKPPERKISAESNKPKVKETDDQQVGEEDQMAKLETSCEQVCTNCKCKLRDIEDCIMSTDAQITAAIENDEIECGGNSEELFENGKVKAEGEKSEETDEGEMDINIMTKYETESIENHEETSCVSDEESAADVETKKEPENELEKSILDIQNQLLAIRELPLQIQNHITLLEKQLSDILVHKIRSTDTSTPNMDAERVQIQEDGAVGDVEQQEGDSIEPKEDAGDESYATYEQQLTIENETIERVLPETGDDDGPCETNAEEHGEGDREPGGRPTYPLTPLPRPIILPGGRKWRGPKDAYNEKFIAETLISQAEVLVGSTLGVNFRKYEPPKFDVSNSAVYKLVHNIETANNGGIENRPEMVAAEEDFYYHKPIDARQYYLATLPQPTIVPDFENENQYGH